jgi:hypothetical protein
LGSRQDCWRLHRDPQVGDGRTSLTKAAAPEPQTQGLHLVDTEKKDTSYGAAKQAIERIAGP